MCQSSLVRPYREQDILSKCIHYAEIKANYTDVPVTQSRPSISVSLASLRSFGAEVGLMIGSVTEKNIQLSFFFSPPHSELKEDGGRIRHSVEKKSGRAPANFPMPGVSSCGYPVKCAQLYDEKSPWLVVSCWPDAWQQEHMTSAAGRFNNSK